MRSTFLYDVRRSFLNRTLVALLVVLLAAGVGLGYAFSRLTLSQSGPGYYIVAATSQNGATSGPVGLLLSPSGPLGNTRLYLVVMNETTRTVMTLEARTNSSGYFALGPGLDVISARAVVNGANVSAAISGAAAVDLNLRLREAVLYFALPSSPQANYSVFVSQARQPVSLSNLSWTYLGTFGPGIHRVNVRIELDRPVLVVGYSTSNSTRDLEGGYEVNVPQLMVESLRSESLGEAVGIFTEFFPLAGLFLVNDLFARHRSTRAIEFILARPLTKLQLIASRYSGGLVALLLSSIVTALAVTAAASAVFGVSFSVGLPLMVFASIVAALAGFYSLLYLVAVLARKSFLVIAIVLYLLLYLFNVGEVTAFILNASWPLYLTPLSSAMSMLDRYLGTSALVGFSVSYLYASLSAAAWAAVPAALAFIIYDRMPEA